MTLEEIDIRAWQSRHDEEPPMDPLPFVPTEQHWLTAAMTGIGDAIGRWSRA